MNQFRTPYRSFFMPKLLRAVNTFFNFAKRADWYKGKNRDNSWVWQDPFFSQASSTLQHNLHLGLSLDGSASKQTEARYDLKVTSAFKKPV